MSSDSNELLSILSEDRRSAVMNKAPKDRVVVASPTYSDNLTQIVEARDQIALVKKNLSTIVDSIANNPSLITRASDAWGEWPIWQKVGTGIVLTVPALLVGVATGVGSLLVIGGATGISYTTTGLVLEDHHVCNVNIKQRLKEGILSLADVLELTIVALDTIRLKLAEEIAKFKEQNSKLALEVCTLQDQIHTISIEVGILVETETFLRITKDKIHEEVQLLKGAAKEQGEVLKKQQDALSAVTRDYQQTQEDLAAKVKELREVREQMASEIANTRKISESLQKAVTTLSGVVIDDEKQREAFQAQLKKVLNGEEASAIKVIERISATQGDLERVTSDLLFNNESHRQLLTKQESLVKKLESLDLMSMVSAATRKENRASVVPVTMFCPVEAALGQKDVIKSSITVKR